MPNISDELEQRKATEPAEPTSEQEPAREEDDASGKPPEPVQAGNLSGNDGSELLEDPTAQSGASGGSRVADLVRKFESPAKPSDKPQAPPPERTKVSAPHEDPAAQSGASGGSRVADLIRKFESPAKPSEKPQAPPPERTKVSALVAKFEAMGRNKDSGTQSKDSEDASTKPASEPSPDKYALLKKDVSTLTEDEKAERANLIIEKYVTDWKTKKEKQMTELTEDLGENEKSKEETRRSATVPGKSKGENFLEGVDKIKELGDTGADIAGDASSFATDVADTAYTAQGKKDHEPTSTAGNIAGIATGAWGTLSGGYGLFRGAQQARQKSKKGDSRGAALSRFDAVSSLFGGASGATGMASGITGLTGGDDASNWLGHASGMAGMGGSLTDMLKGAYQHRSYKNLANRKETVDGKARMANQYMRSTERYKQMKEAYRKGDAGARSKQNRMEMLKQRHDHKRSKDFMEAMSSAQEHAKIKSQSGSRGILSGGLNALSGGMGLAGGFAKHFGGFAGKIAGTVLGGISSLTKYATKSLVDKKGEAKEEAAKKAANDTKGKEYIEEKAAKIMKKADAQADHITEDEAKLIVARRLGVDNAADYAEIYKKLSERRADRILNKEEGYKETLAAMGLTEDADKATILEALGVS